MSKQSYQKLASDCIAEYANLIMVVRDLAEESAVSAIAAQVDGDRAEELKVIADAATAKLHELRHTFQTIVADECDNLKSGDISGHNCLKCGSLKENCADDLCLDCELAAENDKQ